jgi:hypothetical protein
MADRRPARRERLIAANLVRDAWREAMPAAGATAPRLALTTCTTCDIRCERRPTVQALEHLFREAIGRLPDGGTIEVTGRRRGGQRSIEIRVGGAKAAEAGGLRVILARLLLEVQGARLACTEEDGRWVAEVEFAGRN